MSIRDYDYVTTGHLVPINDHIIVTKMEDEDEKVVNGIILPAESGKDRGIRPRWAQVYSIGPDQEDVSPKQWILVEHGRWTRGVKIGDDVFRKVDSDAVMGVSDENPLRNEGA